MPSALESEEVPDAGEDVGAGGGVDAEDAVGGGITVEPGFGVLTVDVAPPARGVAGEMGDDDARADEPGSALGGGALGTLPSLWAKIEKIGVPRAAESRRNKTLNTRKTLIAGIYTLS